MVEKLQFRILRKIILYWNMEPFVYYSSREVVLDDKLPGKNQLVIELVLDWYRADLLGI